MIEALDRWLNEAIEAQQDKIDEASLRTWNEVKHKAHGYLEALYHVQQFIATEYPEKHGR